MASAKLAIPQSWNRYSYVLNNPLLYTDPGGLIWGYKDLEDGKRQFQWFDGKEVGEGFTAYTGTWWVGADTAYHLDPDSANWYGVKKTDFFSDGEWRGLELSTNNNIQNELSDEQQGRLGSGLIYEIKNRPEVKQITQLLEMADNVAGALEGSELLSSESTVAKSVRAAESTAQTETGAYMLDFESGKFYAGKGPVSRMNQSIKRLVTKFNDPLVESQFFPASSNKEAFMKEHQLMMERGGPIKVNPLANTYNLIFSPGRKFFDKH